MEIKHSGVSHTCKPWDNTEQAPLFFNFLHYFKRTKLTGSHFRWNDCKSLHFWESNSHLFIFKIKKAPCPCLTLNHQRQLWRAAVFQFQCLSPLLKGSAIPSWARYCGSASVALHTSHSPSLSWVSPRSLWSFGTAKCYRESMNTDCPFKEIPYHPPTKWLQRHVINVKKKSK